MSRHRRLFHGYRNLQATPPITATVTPSTAFVTDLMIDSLTAGSQTNVPITFGQAFAQGDVPSTSTLTGFMGGVTPIALQVDKKAIYSADGSLRHAVISLNIPTLTASATQALHMHLTPAVSTPAATSPGALLAAGFAASVRATVGGTLYTASANVLLSTGPYTTWLSGNIIDEWHVSSPLKTGAGSAHPHLAARFAIRAHGTSRARVDVAIENNWAYEPTPSNFSYDAAVVIGATTAYSKLALTHFSHARWRKVFWWGTTPRTHERHNGAYLIDSKIVPNYDQTVVINESLLNGYSAEWTGSKIEPMGNGVALAGMPTTGGRRDIGLLPGWAVSYLLTMDKRAKIVTLGTGDLAGSWNGHYRDKNTGYPINLMDYPYMTIAGQFGDTRNPATGLYEAFPACTNCANTNTLDTSHQPGFSYLPYVVTGDYYYLEELHFYCMYNLFAGNPGYRENIKGLFKPDQVRAQAWSIRTLAQAAFITPDSHPFKQDFPFWLDSNREWYETNYSDPGALLANNLGILSHGYAIVYENYTGVSPWMDDFFTSACGLAVELGYSNWATLLQWKSKFSKLRMLGPGFCWIRAGAYTLKVRNSLSATVYSSIAQVSTESHPVSYNAQVCNSPGMITWLQENGYPGLQIGEMTGYAGINTGYPSNMQPALAYNTDVSASAAWTVFMNRSVFPNYNDGAQFAIVPRT